MTNKEKQIWAVIEQAGRYLIRQAPGLGMCWAQLKPWAKADETCATACVNRKGAMRFGPYVLTLPLAQVASVIAHETLHYLLRTFARTDAIMVAMGITDEGKARQVSNVAHDMVINHVIEECSLPLGEGWLTVPYRYNGTTVFEPLFRWLWEDESRRPEPRHDPKPGQGEEADKDQGEGAGEEEEEGEETEGEGASKGDEASEGDGPPSPGEVFASAEVVQGAGMGSMKAANATPARPFTLEEVIKAGLSAARASAGEKAKRTMGVWRKRGSPTAVLLPGRVAVAPTACVIIDVSGSVAREWVAQAAATVVRLSKSLGIKVALITHTSGVEWAGWVGPATAARLTEEATSFSGGTCFAPAYAKADEMGGPRGFDAVIHLTDCDCCDSVWPTVKAPLVVGGLGVEARHPMIPARAKFLPMNVKGGA